MVQELNRTRLLIEILVHLANLYRQLINLAQEKALTVQVYLLILNQTVQNFNSNKTVQTLIRKIGFQTKILSLYRKFRTNLLIVCSKSIISVNHFYKQTLTNIVHF